MKRFSFFLMSVVLLCSLASCQKEQTINSSVPAAQGVGNPSPGDSGNMMKISSSTILNATSASQIPSQMFAVDPMYKTAYIHVAQYAGECSWTCYVLSAGAIARANGKTYPATHTKITAVKTTCSNYTSSTSNPDDRPSDISVLNWYAGAYDNTTINKQIRATPQTTGRFDMIKYMLAHINSYHTPFVALALDPASGIGHYLIVWSIDWKVGGTGSTLYYTNTLLSPQSTFNGNLKSTSLTTFLDWMRDNPQASYYNCLFLWNK